MAAPVFCHEPVILTQGDTYVWQLSFCNYPVSEGWVLTYTFQPLGVGPVTSVTATTSGVNFVATLTATATGAMPSGPYNYQGKVTLAGAVYTVREGQTTIQATTSIEGDNRSQVKRILDALNAAMEGRASSFILDTVVEGTAIRRMSPEQMVVLLNRYTQAYQNELAAARIAAGKGTGRNIFARFTPNNLGWPYRTAISGATPENQ